MANEIQPIELISQYIDLNAVYQAAFHRRYDVVSNLVHDALAGIADDTCDSDEKALLVNCFFIVMRYHIFYRLLDALNCELTDTYASRQALLADYAQWKETGSPGEGDWLTVKGKKETMKVRLFRAMDALLLDPEEFDELPPPEYDVPKLQKKSYGEFDMVTIADAEMTADCGLSRDENPVGKSYLLKDSDGMTYHLKNIRKSHVPGGLHTGNARHFAADGYIEGYTSAEEREIEFEIYDGCNYIFTYSTNGTGDSDADLHPRFAAHEKWVTDKLEARRKRQADLLAAFEAPAD